MQTLGFVSGLHNCLKFSQPLSCLYQAMQTRETFSNASITTNELLGELSSESISSHVKITWLVIWKDHRCDSHMINCAFCSWKNIYIHYIEMVWYFISVNVINRTLHGRFEILIYLLEWSLKIFHSFTALTREIFFQFSKENFVSPSTYVISFL